MCFLCHYEVVLPKNYLIFKSNMYVYQLVENTRDRGAHLITSLGYN